MTNLLLRSGCPDDFLYLGENGQTVFYFAWQIRETLRLHKQQTIADSLAIPQLNDNGSRIDWYAPHPGKVTTWMAASEEQRLSALRHLESFQKNISLLSTQCLHSEKRAQRLFGSLLTKALQFPNSQYIYLVDDKPIITFWGFAHQNHAGEDDVLTCLQNNSLFKNTTMPYAAETMHISDEIYEKDPCFTQPRSCDLNSAYSLVAGANTDIDVVPKRRYGLVAICTVVALSIALASMGFLARQYLVIQPQLHQDSADSADTPHPVVSSPFKKPLMPMLPETTLPLLKATVVPPVVVTPPSEEALIISINEVKNGSTRFLNGTWRVRAQFSDPIAGKPPTLRYQIRNNKGMVSLLNSDNIACKAQIFSGLQPSGTLMIKSRGDARCDDKTRHILPEISCKAGVNGVAECTGRYGGDNLVPVTFEKVSN